MSIICSTTGTQWTVNVNVTDSADGDLSPGVCVGKTDVSEGAGSPALSFPWWEGTRTLVLQLVSHCCSWSETDLIPIRQVKVHYDHPGHEKPKLILAGCKRRKSLRGILPLKCTRMDKIMWQIWSKSGTHRPEAWKPSPEASLGLIVLFHTITAVLQLPAKKKKKKML